MRESIGDVLGPVFLREVVEVARRWRFYISRVLYALTLFVVVLIIWEEVHWRTFGNWSMNARAWVARELTMAASTVQFAAVFLFVPLFLCGTIAGEREERTLDLLFSTHLCNREIVLGKFASRLVALACLIFCGLPVMSLILMYGGGVDPDMLWRVLAVTLLAILFTGAHAIYFSATTANTLAAMVRTYWWLGLWLVGLPLLVAIVVDELPRRAFMAAMAVFLFINPIVPFLAAVDGFFYGTLAGYLGAWFYPAAFVLPTAWSLWLLWRAVASLRREPAPILRWIKRVPVARKLWAWWQERQRSELRRAGAQRTWRGREVFNPLWLRARLTPAFDRTGHLGLIQVAAWAFALVCLLMVMMFDFRSVRDEEASMNFVGIAWGAAAALATLLAGSSFVGDRRRGFLELVLVTPLSGAEIVDGTFLAVWEHVKLLFYLPWALSAVFVLTGASLPWGAAASALTATLFCTLLIWHGLACSLAARTVPAALVGTFLFPLVILVGIPLLFAPTEEYLGLTLWILFPPLLAGSALWARRSLNVASVACLSTSVHLALITVATTWTIISQFDEYPFAALYPGIWIIGLLDDRVERIFRDPDLPWYFMLPCYWASLAVNLIWMRRWLIRHFDALAERVDPAPGKEILGPLAPRPS